MTDGMLIGTPENLRCEAKGCARRATHIYGPECEAQTGKLMYLCQLHEEQIAAWIAAHPNDPVECPTHGRIGKVKDYVVLTPIPRTIRG